jgi:hypothetical protein
MFFEDHKQQLQRLVYNIHDQEQEDLNDDFEILESNSDDISFNSAGGTTGSEDHGSMPP